MLVQCDASQLEWRTILQLAQDEVGIKEVLEKQDAHSLNQAAMNLPSRLIAKIFLFRTIFRGSGWSFANDPDFMHVSTDPKFWDEKNAQFFQKYFGIDQCHKAWAEEVLNTGIIQGPLGRSWSISMKQDNHGAMKMPWTTLTNYPVQGTGADVMMLVRIMFYKKVKENAELASVVTFVSTVHDSIVVDVPVEYVQQVVDLFHECFARLPEVILKNFGYVWNVPMDCECKQGMNMKEMIKVKPNGTH
jgi:DNA polymerase I-like protein with 3'-5' exonuclease and polymerase domains